MAGILSGSDSGAQIQRAFPEVAGRLEELARASFVTGMQWAFGFLFVVALAGFLVTLFGVRRQTAAATSAPVRSRDPVA